MRTHQIPSGLLPSHRSLYYGGGWHKPIRGHYAPTLNPAYNEAICEVPVATAEDVVASAQAAQQAFPAWAATTPKARGQLLHKAADILRRHSQELALLDS